MVVALLMTVVSVFFCGVLMFQVQSEYQLCAYG